jgi:hypothetical protein
VQQIDCNIFSLTRGHYRFIYCTALLYMIERHRFCSILGSDCDFLLVNRMYKQVRNTVKIFTMYREETKRSTSSVCFYSLQVFPTERKHSLHSRHITLSGLKFYLILHFYYYFCICTVAFSAALSTSTALMFICVVANRAPS